MHIIGKVFLSCIAGALLSSMFFGYSVEAQQDDELTRGDYKIIKSNTKYAEDLLDRTVGEENKETGIIATDLDAVDKEAGIFVNTNKNLKISNTLDSTRMNLSSYLEWIAFIGLTAAVALIVYNGILLVFSPLAEDQIAQVKKRLMYIIAGTLGITGFYFVMKILLSFLVEIISRS